MRRIDMERKADLLKRAVKNWKTARDRFYNVDICEIKTFELDTMNLAEEIIIQILSSIKAEYITVWHRCKNGCTQSRGIFALLIDMYFSQYDIDIDLMEALS